VRKADPKARLIATGADPDVFHDWNAAQLANPPDTFNYLSTHFVVTTNSVQAPHPSPDFVAKATFALPIELEHRLRSMHQQFQDTPLRNVSTAFTEWLFWSAEDQFSPRYDNMGGAIGTAGLLNVLLRNSDIVPISDMTGIIEFGGIWKKRGRVFGVPAYWVFRMYSNAEVARLVETQNNGQKYDVEQGSTRLPTIANVPYLDVVAAINRSGNKLTLFCVNRHLTRDIETRIDLSGFRPTNSTARSLFANSIYEKNDETEPEHIHPLTTSLSADSGELKYTFRHESVTVIELGR
jgi:alpha-L-arabinofuranosidase